jgi:hypothetical protein
MLAAQPSSDAGELAQPGYGCTGGFQEEIHAYAEQETIDYAGDKDPFPQFVPADEMMGLNIGLEGYYNFLEQGEGLFIYFG